MTNEDLYVTRNRAAELLGLSLRQVHRLVRAGRIRIHRDEQTGRVGYRHTDVEALMKERARSGADGSA